jgi:hypothetical protein
VLQTGQRCGQLYAVDRNEAAEHDTKQRHSMYLSILVVKI